MKKLMLAASLMGGLSLVGFSAHAAVDLTAGTSTSIDVKVKGTVTQRMQCNVDVANTLNVEIPTIEYKDIKTEEDVAQLQPLMTVAKPKFASYDTVYNSIKALPGYAETPEVNVNCEYGGGKSLLKFSFGTDTSWNQGNNDLILNVDAMTGLDAQAKRDYATILKLATFLYVKPSAGVAEGYRLDLANMSTLGTSITPFQQGSSTFKVGFVLYKRTVDKSNGFNFSNWRPPAESADFTATLPLTLNFN